MLLQIFLENTGHLVGVQALLAGPCSLQARPALQPHSSECLVTEGTVQLSRICFWRRKSDYLPRWVQSLYVTQVSFELIIFLPHFASIKITLLDSLFYKVTNVNSNFIYTDLPYHKNMTCLCSRGFIETFTEEKRKPRNNLDWSNCDNPHNRKCINI